MNISERLYLYLMKEQIPKENAQKICEGLSFIKKDSDDEISEDDIRDIVVIAKSIKNLNDRNKVSAQTDNEAETDENNKNDKTKVIKPDKKVLKPKKENKLVQSLRNKPEGLRKFLTYLIIIGLYILITVSVILAVLITLALVAAIVGVTIAGIVLFFVGIIYGVSELQSFHAGGLYEIGLGILLGGISSLLIVLIFNSISTWIPKLLSFAVKKFRGFLKTFRLFRKEVRI